MKNEILNYLSDFMNAWTLIDLTLITFLAWLASFYRQTWKKQSLIDSGIIARNAIRMDNQEIDAEILKDLKNKNKELSILLHQKRTFADELKKSFEQAVAEIKKLVAENKLLESCNQDNLKLITHWKERALHQKHTKKTFEASEWEYTGYKYNPYSPLLFEHGNKYKLSDVNVKFNKETSICLICENGSSVIADKQYFKPVKET